VNNFEHSYSPSPNTWGHDGVKLKYMKSFILHSEWNLIFEFAFRLGHLFSMDTIK